MSDASDHEGFESDSDAELQAAFASGLLKPGLNIPVGLKKEYVNNVAGLKTKFKDIQQSLKWVERLDLTTGLAPVAPEMALYVAEQEEAPESKANRKKKYLDATLDDFKREMNFHRQAQAAVLEGIPRLHQLNIKTKRPDDYFAQMAKSDEHMQKVRDSLLKRKAGLETSEKVRKARDNRKMMKQLQTEATLRRQKEKKDLMNEVKKYRKGVRKDLDFLEPGGDKKKPGQKDQKKKLPNKAAEMKKKRKDEKYGLGGKKRGLKRNTKESSADVSGYRPPPRHKVGLKNKNKKNRPGKNRRNQSASKRR